MVVRRQMLHARCLGFIHPRTQEELEFEAEVPGDMQQVILFLRGKSESLEKD
jgi:23S rRNA pseudouridine1911/1915/1917 synthase